MTAPFAAIPAAADWAHVFLTPGGLYCTATPTVITTILGSSVPGTWDHTQIVGLGRLTGGTQSSVFVLSPVTGCGTADFNCDGDMGTDADIAAFFACISGACPAAPCASSADFNGDGDIGTDADIEAFFRVLGGAAC